MMALVGGSRALGFIFCRSRFTLPQYRRLKSSYSINKMPNFEEEVEKKEEIEVPGKYMFRPRLPVLIENDRFNVPFQEEYERICREDYAWELELQTLKTVWERLKPPPQEKVEEKVLEIGNVRSLPWTPNEWCIERAFDCHRNRRDAARIHLKIKFLEMLKRLPNLPWDMFGMANQFQQKVLMARTRKLFELVCQTYYTGNLKLLIESDENAEPIVEHMNKVKMLEVDQRELLNITEQDIITIAPGTYGAIQDFFRVYFASTHSLSITCCAAYQKNVLYSVATKQHDSTKKLVAMPYDYHYNVPHLVFGNFDYWYSRKSKRFELHDLHILGFPVLPWYKDVPGTDGKFFSPKYECVQKPSSALFSFK